MRSAVPVHYEISQGICTVSGPPVRASYGFTPLLQSRYVVAPGIMDFQGHRNLAILSDTSAECPQMMSLLPVWLNSNL